jgi:hypothetical protein
MSKNFNGHNSMDKFEKPGWIRNSQQLASGTTGNHHHPTQQRPVKSLALAPT